MANQNQPSIGAQHFNTIYHVLNHNNPFEVAALPPYHHTHTFAKKLPAPQFNANFIPTIAALATT